ncbi:hypothetical protein EPUS_06241 [Endocarpon pusillum Z07020]|uniref:Uncharacterized protein n=1 Tax=Endocarpon pusillum (strain Z07020 / HMAS-L-300199) TaxID=1263415 RepID=U1FVE8_ENDPU|nr:uncharacterized protein EPUS_06241 [Endocarpon pusillum Z07020]ERF68797.1 hypothetical protein EPUS_06241 [Endocarpon pusillum Z07020]
MFPTVNDVPGAAKATINQTKKPMTNNETKNDPDKDGQISPVFPPPQHTTTTTTTTATTTTTTTTTTTAITNPHTMLAFTLTPLLVLLLSGATTAAPTSAPSALLPKISTPETATNSTWAPDDPWRPGGCLSKSKQAEDRYNEVLEKCRKMGFKKWFADECYKGKPKDCCPADQMSKSCEYWWPAEWLNLKE